VKCSFPHTVIRASAGTGKTFQLTNRYIGLLHAGVSPQEILATTFTRKAAGEIFDRVLLRLAQAATNDKSREELSRAIGSQQPLDRSECLHLLTRTLRSMDTLRVGTLDSFFARIASSFALEMGLPPGWDICDERTDAQIREAAIEAVLAREKTADLLALMNLLTKGEAKRSISELVSSTVSQLYNLFRETMPEAWQQVPWVKSLPQEEIDQAIDLLRKVELPSQAATARDKDCEAVLAGDWEAFVKTGLGPKVLSGENVYQRKPIPDEAVALYTKLLKQAESHLVSQIALQTQGTFDLLKKFSEEYERLKHARRSMRFDDITHRLAQAMSQASEQLAYRLDSGISHVLLDEFQDTSLLQWQVIRPLARRVTCGDGSFFCVGDAKQAIYGWRGGLAELFDALGSELQGLSHDALTQSFRSAPPVVEAVNRLFQRMTEHDNLDRMEPAVRDWKKRFPEHTTARGELPGYVSLQAGPLAEEGEEPKEVLFRFAAERIAEAVKLAPGRTVGVLVRTNEAVARLIYLLRDLGVPASEEGGNPLTDSAPIEVIVSLLRVADHPGDSIARFHLAHSPLAQSLGFEAGWQSDSAAAALSQRVRRRLLDEGYGPTIYDWARHFAPHCSSRDLNRLQQLVELAYQYQADSSLRCDHFIELIEAQRMPDPTRDKVRVMTVHQAKGLQFDIVFLPELETRILGQNEWFVAGRPEPTQPIDVVCRYVNQNARQMLPKRIQELFEDTTRQDVDESLCVLYVALTRAVHALHMLVLPQEKPGKLPKTFAGLLRAGLCEGKSLEPLEIGYHTGDQRWYEKLPAAAENTTEVAGSPDATTEPLQIQFANSASRKRGLDRASPSQLEGGQRLPLIDVFRPQASQARHQGTLVHAWMQLVQWLDDGLPTEAALAEAAEKLAGEIGDVSAELKSMIAGWRRALSQSEIKEALTRGFYRQPSGYRDANLTQLWQPNTIHLDVHNERSFAVRDGEQLLVGTIDRLVLIRSGSELIAADIVDYKTDQLSRDNPSMIDQRVEFYRPQLAAYRRAVAQLYRLDPSRIATRLVFLTVGQVRTLDQQD
jgi:ATP-dependent helicase/nuclease subunit A